jgi:hypothetical protein
MTRSLLSMAITALSGLLLCSSVALPVVAHDVSGKAPKSKGATKAWLIDEARVEAFTDIQRTLDLSEIPDLDPNMLENQESVRRKQDIVGERLYSRFRDGAYSVSKLCDPRTYYYYPNGKLIMVEEETAPPYYNNSCKKPFPKKSYKYLYPSGRLSGVSVDISNYESFVFAPDGTLNFHWVGSTCYDRYGNRCKGREAFQVIPPRRATRF